MAHFVHICVCNPLTAKIRVKIELVQKEKWPQQPTSLLQWNKVPESAQKNEGRKMRFSPLVRKTSKARMSHPTKSFLLKQRP